MPTTTILRLAVVAGLLFGTIAGAATDAEKCQAAKNKIAGKYAFCRLKAQAKALKTGETVDDSKCQEKFLEKFAGAETLSCSSTGDVDAIEIQVTTDTDFIALRLAGARFVDNGDGTVTDTQTGLMWEKKGNLDALQNPADPHDADNTYNWSADPPDNEIPNGGVFTDFLFALNNCTSTDGITLSGGFAGHCDWRIPSSAELATIVDTSVAGCDAGSACIAAPVGPTIPIYYWTSTLHPFAPAFAFAVQFEDGSVNWLLTKSQFRPVRAVRALRMVP